MTVLMLILLGFSPSQESRLFEELFQIVEENFYDKAKARTQVQEWREKFKDKTPTPKTINEMLSHLDASHTAYYTDKDPEYYHLGHIFFNQEKVKALFDHKEVIYPSIGIQVSENLVLGVYDGGPAHKAGIKRGDRILWANDNPFQPVESLKTEKVVLKVKRNQKELSFQMNPIWINPGKEMLKAQENSVRLFEKNKKKIGYIHVWSYAGERYHKAMIEAILWGKLKEADALIWDLRDGWGGANPEYLNLFNPNVPKISHISRDKAEMVYDTQWRKPVVMLINNRVRSGKEVLAYGFKKHRIGKVVGERTAGAVLGGGIFVLSNRALLYLACVDARVDGEVLEGHGVLPDVRVPLPIKEFKGEDLQLKAALKILLN